MPINVSAENSADFLVLKSSKINMRYGPGRIYPIKWIYCKKNMPLEILDEFEDWVKVRDIDGETGWLLQGLVSRKHINAVVTKKETIRKNKKINSPIRAHVDRLVLVRVKKCVKDFCKIEIDKTIGWMPKNSLWAIPKKTKQL